MAGLVPAIHAFRGTATDVKAQDKPGHEESSVSRVGIIPVNEMPDSSQQPAVIQSEAKDPGFHPREQTF